jgi:hypothetical protein
MKEEDAIESRQRVAQSIQKAISDYSESADRLKLQ